MYRITKRYGHNQGLSCAFRQWRAKDTHCRFIHGYALSFEIEFEGEDLDERNWLISFGELKKVLEWLKNNFDHKTCIAHDDPELQLFLDMEKAGIIQLNIVKDVGCEKFAEWVYENVTRMLFSKLRANNVRVSSVKVSEHEGNSATYVPTNTSTYFDEAGVLRFRNNVKTTDLQKTYLTTKIIPEKSNQYYSTQNNLLTTGGMKY